MKRIIHFIALAILCSCAKERIPWIDNTVYHKVSMEIDPWEGWESESKSMIGLKSMDEIRRISILVYKDNGKEFVFDTDKSVYTSNVHNLELALDQRINYKIYFLANPTGDLREQAVKWKNLNSAVNNIRMLYGSYDFAFKENGLPLLGFLDVPAGSKAELKVNFTRLYSRWKINVDCSELKYSTMKINNLKICNSPCVVYPMAERSFIQTLEESSTQDYGDYASEADLDRLAQGESIYLYILENVKGSCPVEGDRTPSGLYDAGFRDELYDETFTYIKINASVNTPSAIYDNVEYKANLGENHDDDFSIYRNTTRNLTIKFHSDRVEEIEWKVTPDLPVQVFDPRLQISVSTYANNQRAWVPRIDIEPLDCELLSSIVGDFMENISIRIQGRSVHSATVDYRSESEWINRHTMFLANGGRLTGNAVYHEARYVNGTYRDAYYSRKCVLGLSDYERTCNKYTERDGHKISFLPCPDERAFSQDSFYTIINPSNYGGYCIESEFYDGDSDDYYAPWYWNYCPVDYTGDDNGVWMRLEVMVPSSLMEKMREIYLKKNESCFTLIEDYSKQCPEPVSRLEVFGWDGFELFITEVSGQ